MTLLLAAATAQAQVPVRVVLQEGQMPTGANGATVTGVFNPATNGLGQLAVIAALDSGEHALWFDQSIGFLSSMAPNTLTLSNPRSVGHSDAGAFVYAPIMDGVSALWTDNGVLFMAGDVAPGSPIGQAISELLLPKMRPDGQIYFLAKVGNSYPDYFYISDGTVAGTTAVLETGGLISGAATPLSSVGGRSIGPEFYDVADDGTQYVIGVTLQPTNEEAVVVNGALHLQQGDSTGDGDDWLSFHEAAINAAGDVLVSARTTGANDEVIAVNGQVVIREGDTIGDVALASMAVPQALSVNDAGYATHYWTHNGGATLFFSCDVSQLADNSQPLLRTGEMVQVIGGDSALLTGIDATFPQGPALDLASGVDLFVRVQLDQGAGPLATIIQVQGNCCGNGVLDSNEQCDDGNTVDGDGCSATCNDETMGTGGAGGMGVGGGGGAGGAAGSGRPAVTGGCDCTAATGRRVLGGDTHSRWQEWLALSWLALGAVFLNRRRAAQR